MLTILSSEDAATLDVRRSRTAITAAGGHEALLTMLRSDPPTTDMSMILAREAAAAALANLCAQDDTRACVVEQEGVEVLVNRLARDESDELLKYACGAIGNLARVGHSHVDNQDAIAAAGGIEKLIALARSVGIRDNDGEAAEVESLLGSIDDPEADDGIELNASIALRKLAIGHEANYRLMTELLTHSQLMYFLYARLPNAEGTVPEGEVEGEAPP